MKVLRHIVVLKWNPRKIPFGHEETLTQKLKQCVMNIPSVKKFNTAKNIGLFYLNNIILYYI